MRQIVLALALLFAGTVRAGAEPLRDPDQVDRQAAERIAQAKEVYGVPDPRARCKPGKGDEIVVCVDRGEDLRVPSTAESDPNSREARRALDGNIPSAPDVSYIKCRRGKDGVCRGNFGGAPAPVYYVDVSKLPQAPEGSDADRIAKGEAPAP